MVARSGRLAERGLEGMATSRLVWALPFFAFVLVNSMEFIILLNFGSAYDLLFFEGVAIETEESDAEESAIFKQLLQFGIYGWALMLAAINFRAILGYFYSNPHLLLLLLLLLLGVLHGSEPVKVLTNTIIIAVGLLIAILFAQCQSGLGNYRMFYYMVFLAMFIVCTISLAILAIYDPNIPAIIVSERRYGGVAGSPNALGAVSVLGIWGALCLLMEKGSSRKLRFMCWTGIGMFLVCVGLSGSGTAVAMSLIVFVTLYVMRFIALWTPGARLVLVFSTVLLVVISAMSLFVAYTPYQLLDTVTSSLGKDVTLTGRTLLWEVALDAIAEKPWLGWGFDSHLTVLADPSYEIKHKHFHNGYLDNLLVGGVPLLILLAYNIGRFLLNYFRLFEFNSRAFPLILPLIVMAIANISEYSMLRPASPIWQIYITTFVMLTYALREAMRSQGTKRARKPRRRRGDGRRMRRPGVSDGNARTAAR